ncbi:hypothetical protein P106B_57 [Rhizobium phage vB_RglS_P106B]|uniref:Uncharacterized protein n=1 Tax=Rhizobium phage vB_RglS_P106B TaxID=1458697 RepID=W6E8H5_9CAUD|nr:hypothetical protein P106B_57 [Rhizobium phage vB_RglS_P106B]AHJ10740.1 hypothetical protein P106B_57 [Rhizobium phage vB_RglS_P106B]
MKPVMCTVKDDPERGLYGDCVRACVASILEIERVPHFYATGDGGLAFEEMREWLSAYGRIPAYFPLIADYTLDQVLNLMEIDYPGVEYMLFCSSGGGDHCVIGRNNAIIHNPAWFKSPIDGPHSQGVWIVIILAKV